MLRASADANAETVDLRGVAHVAVDSGVPGARELLAVTDAVVLRDDAELASAIERSVDRLGTPTTVRAISVAADFEMMNRLLDATGVGPTASMRPVGALLDVALPARFG